MDRVRLDIHYPMGMAIPTPKLCVKIRVFTMLDLDPMQSRALHPSFLCDLTCIQYTRALNPSFPSRYKEPRENKVGLIEPEIGARN